MDQRLPRWLDVVVGPFEEPEISVGILHPRVQANSFPVLSGSFGTLTQASQRDPAKIVDSRIVRLFAFCGGQLYERLLQSILL